MTMPLARSSLLTMRCAAHVCRRLMIRGQCGDTQRQPARCWFSTSTASTSPLSPSMQDDAKYIVHTYARQPYEFVRGKGCTLYDSENREYLDFYSGIAVNALGHAHPAWVQAVQTQAEQLCHVSNLFYSVPQVELAKQLVENSIFDRVFFCNSGTEANEAALKFARRFAFTAHQQKQQTIDGKKKHTDKHTKTNIVAFNGGFHGRTLGALSMTYKQAYKLPFEPLVPGITFVNYNEIQSTISAINADTCAVIVEPIQGEGGVYPATPAFLSAIRSRCTEMNALMIMDEVQAGLGRTGRLFCYEHFPDIQPDMVSLAKPLAGGLPIGALLVKEHVAKCMQPGDHGTTFAGGPLVCSAALATLGVIKQADFIQAVQQKGQLLLQRLQQLQQKLEQQAEEGGVRVLDIRGLPGGLLIGVELNTGVKSIISDCARRGVVFISAGDRVLRLVPPLIISEEETHRAMDILTQTCLEHSADTIQSTT